MKTPVFAVDVGYSNTKYAYRVASGEVEVGIFPSLAPLAPIRTFSGDAESVFGAPNLATITIKQIEYTVGPDVPMTARYGWTGSALGDDYALSDNYAALLYGAIHFSGVTHIKYLVLGLPVLKMKKYSAELKERFVGEHDFGHGCVTVEKVLVIPQPLGSLLLAASYPGGCFGNDDAHLVIDVGHVTTDWIYTNGFMMDQNRGDSVPSALSQISQQIADIISNVEGERVYDIERIDKALREKAPFFFYGKSIDLAPYFKRAAPIVSSLVMEMRNRIGPTPDVRSIILSGGGSALYASAIRTAFPRTVIEPIDFPCIANARGFLIAGEAALAREYRVSSSRAARDVPAQYHPATVPHSPTSRRT